MNSGQVTHYLPEGLDLQFSDCGCLSKSVVEALVRKVIELSARRISVLAATEIITESSRVPIHPHEFLMRNGV